MIDDRLPSDLIKHGLLENGPLISDGPRHKTPFSSAIFQQAMLDYQRVYHIPLQMMIEHGHL